MVWDQGTYEPAEEAAKSKKGNEKILLHQLYSGKIKFILHGEKLNGLFALVKSHGRGENAWLFMKLEDEFASKDDMALQDKSVLSDLNLEEIAASSDNIYGKNNKTAKVASKKTVKKALEKQVDPDDTDVPEAQMDVATILRGAPKGKFDTSLKPMLATLVRCTFR